MSPAFSGAAFAPRDLQSRARLQYVCDVRVGVGTSRWRDSSPT